MANPYVSNTPQNRQNPEQGGKKGAGCVGAVIFVIFLFASVFNDAGGAFFIFIPLLIVAAVVGTIVFVVIKASKAQRTASDSFTRSDGHLCDPGAHKGSSIQDSRGFDAIQEMESGYKLNTAEPNFIRNKYKMRVKKLTPEQLRRKREELHDLLEAGIIESAEYRLKMDEYDD